MEEYIGQIFGIRFYTSRMLNGFQHANDTVDYLVGGHITRWYSPRQHAKCKISHNYVTTLMMRQNAKTKVSRPAPCDNLNHRCGINAYTVKQAKRMLEPNPFAGRTYGDWLAVTELWGDIQCDTLGYRASDARVIELHWLHGLLDDWGYSEAAPRLGRGWKKVPVFERLDFDHIVSLYGSNNLTAIPSAEGIEGGRSEHR